MKRYLLIIFLVLQFSGISKVFAQELENSQLIIINNKNLNAEATKTVTSTDKYTTGQLMRHTRSPKISIRFQVSPKDINSTGVELSGAKVTWAQAMGYDVSEDGNNYTDAFPTFATPKTGCAAYKGPGNNDSEGDWRVPNYRELLIITMLRKKFPAASSMSGNYWSSTEVGKAAFLYNTTSSSQDNYYKTATMNVRCIKDLPLQ